MELIDYFNLFSLLFSLFPHLIDLFDLFVQQYLYLNQE
jgi:hypothetical protein